jgi:excisionase family DNA binding protein
MDKLLTVPQVAGVFQVTPYTVRQWLRDGKLKGIRPANGPWRIPESAVQEFANEKYGETNAG